MSQPVHVIDRYMRTNKLPHIWCAGCGHGTVMNALIRAIDNTGLKQEEVVVISGIGCSGRASGYLNFCGFQPTHGRALPFATGVKLFNPKLNVITIMGDGDCASIGGNHFIHAARRNIDMLALVINNSNYGMTGGQYAPTTPEGALTTTSPYGHIEPPFDVCKLAETAGATYVARATSYHITLLIKYLENALTHKGFSVVEVVNQCPTLFGRLNKLGSPTKMLLALKERSVMKNTAEKMPQEELKDKIVIGEFVKINKPEYTELYDRIIEKAQREVE